MTDICFKVDKVNDAYNWRDCANNNFYGVDLKNLIPNDVLLQLQSVTKDNAITVLDIYLANLYKDVNLAGKAKVLQDRRNKNVTEIFAIMENATGKCIPV